jgi:hypothetical protein
VDDRYSPHVVVEVGMILVEVVVGVNVTIEGSFILLAMRID